MSSCKMAVGHGQMEAKKLEAVILDFMDGCMMYCGIYYS